MAALFYKPTVGRALFKGDFPVVDMVRVELFENIAEQTFATIITNVGIGTSDTIQFFLTFDDVVNYFYFGKGIGNIVVNGMILSDCLGEMPGINQLYSTLGLNRGTRTRVSMGNFIFEGVITSCNLNVMADPALLAEFSINMAMVNHSLGSPLFIPQCGV